MPIRPAAAHELKLARERVQPLRVVPAVTWMQHLETIESQGRERGDALPRGERSRVRKDRDPAGAMDDGDGVAERQLVFGHVRRATVPEIPLECLLEVRDETLGDNGARYVRPPHRSSSSVLEHVLHRDGHAERVESLDHGRGTRNPHLAEIDEMSLQLTHLAEMQSQYVRLHVVLDRTQLDPRDDAQREPLTRIPRWLNARDRIVIGQGDGGESRAGGRGDDFSGRARSVRRCGMHVEVDELMLRAPARHDV